MRQTGQRHALWDMLRQYQLSDFVRLCRHGAEQYAARYEEESARLITCKADPARRESNGFGSLTPIRDTNLRRSESEVLSCFLEGVNDRLIYRMYASTYSNRRKRIVQINAAMQASLPLSTQRTLIPLNSVTIAPYASPSRPLPS